MKAGRTQRWRRRPSRWIGSLLLLTLLLLSLLSCRNEVPRVALFYYNGEDPYIRTFVDQIESAAGDRFRLTSLDARNSQTLQNEQIDDALEERLDLAIVNPVDRLSSYAIIRRLQEAGIPIVFFNREPLPEDLYLWEHTYYVGARAEQSAWFQAELVMELFGGNPENLNHHDKNGDGAIQTIILKGEQGHQDAEIRTTEVLRSFDRAGFSLDILAIEVCNWMRDEAYNRMEELLREHGEAVELVISNNDAMALGAISRMRQEGYLTDTDGNGRLGKSASGWVPVVGIDGLQEAVEQIEAGYLYGTVKNDSESMAVAIVELSTSIVAGGDLQNLSYPLENRKYIWIDYQPFSLR